MRGGYLEEEDEESIPNFLLHPPTATPSAISNANSHHQHNGGSGGLAPSKSTVYASNLDFSLTNSDLFTIFSTFGKVAKVTVLKDRVTRRSRGVAFVLFVSQSDARAAAASLNGKTLNGRTIKVSIAADNGRAPEFIRRRVYKDKSRCYECGMEGHLSYECPSNQLGPRERPAPSKRGRGRGRGNGRMGDFSEEDEEDEGRFEEDNWASVVETSGVEERDERREENKRHSAKRISYFSDESGEED
ncbi:hypothetical protein AMTRI_Chr07g28570 [Amborella trichopoda]|uniref:Uncharacterized protein n=1 Tax=Amborella trichopoda TaxID=13333 RepID=W1NUW1_AMBTC|nr:hypothetical protein AMTR_s00072p00141070 [Amborella trichopoda]